MEEGNDEIERGLDVLERNQLIAKGSLALLIAGPLLLVLAATGVFPPGFFGFHLGVFGALGLVASRRGNTRPTRRNKRVRVSADGVHVDGKLAVRREDIADGFFQPRPQRSPSKWRSSFDSSVRLVSKRRTVLFEAETTEAEALAILRTLGLDPGSKRAEWNGSSPLYSTFVRNLLFVGGVMVATVACDRLLAGRGGLAFPFLMVPLMLAGLIPSKIAVGVDGVLVRWLWQKKFIAMSEISSVLPEADRTILIRLRSGATEKIHTSMRRQNGFGSGFAKQHRDAVLARIAEALATYRARGPVADVSALVGKGSRTRREWLDALGRLHRAAEGGSEGYRLPAVRDEDLFRVVEDPTAPADARAGAARVLRQSLDDAGKARVRIAAEATASPKLRVALDAVAGEAADAAVDSALEELVDEEPKQRAG